MTSRPSWRSISGAAWGLGAGCYQKFDCWPLSSVVTLVALNMANWVERRGHPGDSASSLTSTSLVHSHKEFYFAPGAFGAMRDVVITMTFYTV